MTGIEPVSEDCGVEDECFIKFVFQTLGGENLVRIYTKFDRFVSQ